MSKYKNYTFSGIISGNVEIPIKARNSNEARNKLFKKLEKKGEHHFIENYNRGIDIEFTVYETENGKEYRLYQDEDKEK